MNLEEQIRRYKHGCLFGPTPPAEDALSLLEDVLDLVPDIEVCAVAAVQCEGDDAASMSIRGAGVTLCAEFGVDLRQSEMEPS